jgi:hemerythrin superfamily protein
MPSMRSIAEQSQEQLGGAASVLVRQRRDHAELGRLLGRLAAAEGAAQEAVLNRIARLVFPHAFAEEAVLWPAVRKALPDGEPLTLRIEQEHQEVNELWAALERTASDDPHRRALLDRLVRVLQEDVRDEEDVLLPRLQAALDTAALRRLGVAWELVRRTAPTRPHPVVARRPPGNALAALPLTLLDRTRDHLDGWGSGEGRVAGPSRAASRALASVAGRIEQLPPLRRGETASTRSGRTEAEGGS